MRCCRFAAVLAVPEAVRSGESARGYHCVRVVGWYLCGVEV